MEQFPAVHVKVKDSLGSSTSDLDAELAVEGVEPRAETGGTRIELCRTAKDRRDRGNEEVARGGRCNRNICERATKFTLRSKRKGCMTGAVPTEERRKMSCQRHGFQLRLKARQASAARVHRNQPWHP